ncbi:MFS transporter [Methanospirillum stamsii]|uniref:MFS transporter n=1 Tax=Methanospirillum stamsii TaxID=1277351 RepID=A0A2V2N2K3_9EURY|nr:MFS transporter [Methanospirillum stamsii]PWR70407.1 MFS transporter [Methanospirillum stamsii]
MSSIISNHLHQKLLLMAVAIGMFLDGLDGSIVTIILPRISESFNIDTGTASWVIITYLLMMAGLILIIGKTAERGHIKSLFLGGVCVFTLGSVACGISPDFGLLLSFRVIQGVGAAMIAATASLLCVTYLPKNMLGMALGAISMSVSLGVVAGPAIGGFISQYLSWHWAFLINLPIGILILPFAMYIIPPDMPRENRSFDHIGAVFLFGLMASGVFVLERISHLKISDWQILLSGLLCMIFFILFLYRERSYQSPLINIRLFRLWSFSATLILFLIFGCVSMGIFYLLPFFLQAAMSFDPAMAGLYLLIPPVVTAIIGVPVGRWSDRAGRKPFAIAASLGSIAATAIFMSIIPETGFILLPLGLVLTGLFMGFMGGPVASWVVDNAPPDEKGTGSSLMITSVYLGSAIGTALFATFFTWGIATEGIVAFSDLNPIEFMQGFHFSMTAGLFLSVLALVISVIVREKKDITSTQLEGDS